MTIHQLLSSFDYESLLKYGAFLGVQIFLTENLWILLVTYDEVYKYGKKVEQITFAFELSDSKLLSEVEGMVAVIKFVTCINYLLGICTSLTLLCSQDILKDIIYLRVWICQNFSATTCSIVGYSISLLDIPIICSTVSMPFLLVYFEIVDIVHVKYLNELIKTICESSLLEEELYNSELFQRIVSQKLKICIMMHEKLINVSLLGTEMIYIPVLLVALGSLILGSSMLLFILALDFEEMNVFLIGIFSGTVNYLICVWLYIYFSQLLKNESEHSYYLLTQLPWYYMNKNNRQMFSVLLRKAEKPISCQTNILEVNFLLVVRIFKSLYSVAAIITRFQPRLE
ncbi:uncharacterized protein LOC123314118 [Coccinella septempunctata]|uniref:uncharacterized protein LOC123314118 n=1 Tax=Coccinella septempunctata TaxID=41139 RepID=UPI001D0840AA|nr:uncharacterized protein LOC123314118 [Coccinella septempunctata]